MKINRGYQSIERLEWALNLIYQGWISCKDFEIMWTIHPEWIEEQWENFKKQK